MARERIARALGCASEELIFTGGGSESNNLAVRGALPPGGATICHVVTSQIEHSSVLKTCQVLEEEGHSVTYLGVDGHGRFDTEELEKILGPDTVLVSLGWVNNEIGTVQDIETIVRIVKGRGVTLHMDAVQALPYLPMNLAELGVDLMSFSGHKLYAPKGVGLLYVRRGTSLRPIVHGGGQEFGLRSGTENVPYAVGLSRAVRLNRKERARYSQKLTELRDRIISTVLETIPDVLLSGHPISRSPNSASFCFQGVNGKMLVKELAHHGLEASSGSACSSPRNEPSHVLEACGVPQDYLLGSLRITLGRYNTKGDVDTLLRVLPRVVSRMRSEPRPYNNDPIFISQDEFRAKVAAGEPIQILDVRSPRIPAGDIPGSIHIPVWRLKANLRKLDPSLETVVVCYQGDIISPEVQQVLTKHRFVNARILKGGYFSYVGFGF